MSAFNFLAEILASVKGILENMRSLKHTTDGTSSEGASELVVRSGWKPLIFD